MFIDFTIKQNASSEGATPVGKRAYMPLLQSLVRFPDETLEKWEHHRVAIGPKSRVKIIAYPGYDSNAISQDPSTWR